MRFCLILSFLLITAASSAQTSKKLIGTWKVRALSDSEMFVDLGKGTVTSAELSGLDSFAKKEMTSFLLQQFGQVIYRFEAGGKYEQKHNNVVDGTGIWETDTKTALITLNGKRNGISFTEKWSYNFKDTDLILTEQKEDKPMTLTLELQH